MSASHVSRLHCIACDGTAPHRTCPPPHHTGDQIGGELNGEWRNWRPNRRKGMLEQGGEGSLDSTARSPPAPHRGALLRGGRLCPAIRRGGAAPSARTGHGGAREVPEASRPGPSRVAPTDSLEAERQDKLYHKVMFLYLQLAPLKEQIKMCEPIGWRPELPRNISLEEQLRILQARLDAKLRPAPPSAPADP
jgi:hypothetical protein